MESYGSIPKNILYSKLVDDFIVLGNSKDVLKSIVSIFESVVPQEIKIGFLTFIGNMKVYLWQFLHGKDC